MHMKKRESCKRKKKKYKLQMRISERYDLFIYKFISIKSNDGLNGQVLSAYFAISILQTINLLAMFCLIIGIIRIDFNIEHLSTFQIVCFFILPPLLLNYFFIYNNKRYKTILYKYKVHKIGSLKYLFGYMLISFLFLTIAFWLYKMRDID